LAPIFVVQTKHMQLDLLPNGGTASNCAVVLPNLKTHVEERVQHPPEPVAKLTISESMLSENMQKVGGRDMRPKFRENFSRRGHKLKASTIKFARPAARVAPLFVRANLSGIREFNALSAH
jgi:hypothetical protein